MAVPTPAEFEAIGRLWRIAALRTNGHTDEHGEYSAGHCDECRDLFAVSDFYVRAFGLSPEEYRAAKHGEAA